MRLINTATGAFEEFIGYNKPEYAILSHTWGDEEVSYKDISDPICVNKKGYEKIKMTCDMAAKDGIKYAWVDTCNIDKSSSAELTEAINSMFQWYQRSKVCYVILDDLPAYAPLHRLRQCRWFTRGWTLQELIAPEHVLFFDQDWNCRGSKYDLVNELSEITNVDTAVLLHERLLSTVAIARRMSWAAQRETTRIEDMAYCLMGIFDVNMPLLYGEEGKAFRRLQEEIIKSTSDLSIFAWVLPKTPELTTMTQHREVCGLLAPNPGAYASCLNITKDVDHVSREFAVTNIGIKTQNDVILERLMTRTEKTLGYVLPLRSSSASGIPLGVRLRHCGFDQFVREDPWNLLAISEGYTIIVVRDRYLLTELPQNGMKYQPTMRMSSFLTPKRSHVLQFRREPRITIRGLWDWGRYDVEDELFFVSGDTYRDSCSIQLEVKIPGQSSKFEYSFYASGWSKSDPDDFQYTLVEDELYTSSLNKIETELATWNPSTNRVIGALRERGIPKTSFIAVKRRGMRETALISCVATRENDPSVCWNTFWRASFSFQFVKDGQVPKVQQSDWHMLDDNPSTISRSFEDN